MSGQQSILAEIIGELVVEARSKFLILLLINSERNKIEQYQTQTLQRHSRMDPDKPNPQHFYQQQPQQMPPQQQLPFSAQPMQHMGAQMQFFPQAGMPQVPSQMGAPPQPN